MARYFMYSQVYFHRVRRIFDIHLGDFLKEYLMAETGNEFFPTDPEQHLTWTDAEITAALLRAARDIGAPGHEPARRIVERDPYKLLWERTSSEVRQNLNVGEVIARAATKQFGNDAVRRDYYLPDKPYIDFPVLLRNGVVASARSISSVLENLPPAAFDFVFIRPELLDTAKQWLEVNRGDLLQQAPTEED